MLKRLIICALALSLIALPALSETLDSCADTSNYDGRAFISGGIIYEIRTVMGAYSSELRSSGIYSHPDGVPEEDRIVYTSVQMELINLYEVSNGMIFMNAYDAYTIYFVQYDGNSMHPIYTHSAQIANVWVLAGDIYFSDSKSVYIFDMEQGLARVIYAARNTPGEQLERVGDALYAGDVNWDNPLDTRSGIYAINVSDYSVRQLTHGTPNPFIVYRDRLYVFSEIESATISVDLTGENEALVSADRYYFICRWGESVVAKRVDADGFAKQYVFTPASPGDGFDPENMTASELNSLQYVFGNALREEN